MRVSMDFVEGKNIKVESARVLKRLSSVSPLWSSKSILLGPGCGSSLEQSLEFILQASGMSYGRVITYGTKQKKSQGSLGSRRDGDGCRQRIREDHLGMVVSMRSAVIEEAMYDRKSKREFMDVVSGRQSYC
jgi:hypothetical protein